MKESDLEILTALSNTPGMGSIRLQQLLSRYGSLEDVFCSRPQDWGALPGFGPRLIENWKNTLATGRGKQQVALAEKSGVALLPYFHPLYPARFRQLADFPLILYVKGSLV